MALPTGPIDLPVFDDIIETPWGISVAQSLNNLAQRRDHLVYNPTGEILAPNSTAPAVPTDLVDWFRVGGSSAEITVPDWASFVYVHVEMNGIYETGTNTPYALQVRVGPQRGRRVRQTAHTGTIGMSWTSYVGCSSVEGDRGVWIAAGRLGGGGSGRWAIDADSDVTVVLDFTGAIGDYP